MTIPHIPVHIYHQPTADTLFTAEEATLLLMMCTGLDVNNKYEYTIKTRETLWTWVKLRYARKGAVSSAAERLTSEHKFVVTRKRLNVGRHRQVYVLRKTLTQLKKMEISDVQDGE